jgi:hypothetical protein
VAAVSRLAGTPLRRSHLGWLTSSVSACVCVCERERERETGLYHDALRALMQLQAYIPLRRCRQWLLDHSEPPRYAVVA